MKKLLSIFTAVMLLGCTTNHDEVVVTIKSAKSTAISKEQALNNLYGELKLLDGDTRTGGSQRRVNSIKSLKGAVTRSGNALDNNLLYIVEFDEGQGSAILAADTRLKPVIAVLDSYVFTAQDFASDDMEDISVYMASVISDYAEEATSVASVGLLPAPGHTVVDTIYEANIPPMLKTKWHQRTPYNNRCLNMYGSRMVAGCTTIAMAQFVYFHKRPNTINGYDVNWDLLAGCEYEPVGPEDFGGTIGGGIIGGGNISFNPNPGADMLSEAEVAKFVYNIGTSIGIDYSSYETTTYAEGYFVDMLAYLQSVGYNCYRQDYDKALAKNIIREYKPILIVGCSEEEGHAWILDGWKSYIIRTTTALPLPDGPVGTVEPEYEITEEYFDRIHCNFGWGGECDGYYIGDVFDCRYENNNIEPGIGDIPDSQNGDNVSDYYYNRQLTIIRY